VAGGICHDAASIAIRRFIRRFQGSANFDNSYRHTWCASRKYFSVGSFQSPIQPSLSLRPGITRKRQSAVNGYLSFYPTGETVHRTLLDTVS
jgi:hypothetical protein